jgi:very-long-chain enoyl-CoA reductase
MKLTIQNRKKTEEIEVSDAATVADVKRAFMPKVSPHRKSFKLVVAGAEPKAYPSLSEGKPLSAQGVKSGATLLFKDLGPQVGYRMVFVVEYAGPIAFMLLYAMRPALIYGEAASKTPLTDAQKLYSLLFVLHFVKRELETFFVHKFSRPTMPLSNIFKNSAYYWLFAAFIGYVLAHPDYTPASAAVQPLAIGGWALSELLNFAVHYQLSTMRSGDGDQTRKAPRGGFFSLVSCPNYTFEVLSWVFFSLGSGIAASWFFTTVGFAQMADWALKKHRAYVKGEPDLKKRKAIVPFLI